MKKRNIFGYTLFMLIFSFLTLGVVAQALTGKSFLNSTADLFKPSPKQTVADSFTCSAKPAIQGLDQAKDPQLHKLYYYQQVCHSAVTSTMMIFTNMPKDDANASDNARKMAGTLKEFAHYGIRPLVIAEPVTDWGNVDFAEFKSGFYDNWLATYFKVLKAQGITDQQMGIWVPFPEANLPYWNIGKTTPQDYATNVNKYLTIATSYFPQLQGSVMLNSATYSASDFNWSSGQYESLIPYVKYLNKNLIHSFGLQGFPWMPPANQAGPGIFDPAEFLSYKLAKEAADTIGTKNIWFNTGTFSTKYVGDQLKQAYVSPEQRADTLNSVIAQAQALQKLHYSVSINLFAQDKSLLDEATDWSYFNDHSYLTSPSSPVFDNFASRLNQNHIALWLFDREN